MAKKERCPNCGGWLPDGVHAASVRVSSRMAQPATPKAHPCDCPEGRTAARNYGTGSTRAVEPRQTITRAGGAQPPLLVALNVLVGTNHLVAANRRPPVGTGSAEPAQRSSLLVEQAADQRSVPASLSDRFLPTLPAPADLPA